MPSKYLRRCSWAGNNTSSFQHSLLIKQNKINQASGKNPERNVALFVGLIEKGKRKEKKKTFTLFFFCNSAVGGYVNIHFIPSRFLINE